MISGSLEYIFLEKVWSCNLTEKIVDENGEISIYGIYLDEEIISTLPETSPITNDVIKKIIFLLKQPQYVRFWKLYEIMIMYNKKNDSSISLK